MPLKKKKVLGRPLYLVPVRDRAALEIVKGKADECLTPSPGAWVAPKVRQSRKGTHPSRCNPMGYRADRRGNPPANSQLAPLPRSADQAAGPANAGDGGARLQSVDGPD